MKDTLKLSYRLLACILVVALISFFVVIAVGMDSPELIVIDAEDQPIEYKETPLSISGNISAAVLTFFLCVMVYTYSWEQGFKDYNRKFSRPIVHYTLKGFVSGLIAVIPILIMGAIALSGSNVFIGYAYKVIVAPFIHWYNKMLKAGNYVFCQFIYLIVPIVSGISYIMGKHNFMPATRLVYGKSKNEDTPEKATSAMDIMNEKNRNNLK
ncbi:MAG: hypothetical protein II982_04360 [Clostridia bacterium]|nr:hypothetical protein [Clostridia bacterium]